LHDTAVGQALTIERQTLMFPGLKFALTDEAKPVSFSMMAVDCAFESDRKFE